MIFRAVFFVLLLAQTVAVQAETISCPELSTAVQIGNCPTEDELNFTFNGYCNDNARMYDKENTDVCTDYRRYRRLKNTAPWEAGGGAFQAYLSCDLPAVSIAKAGSSGIAVARQGKITKVVCSYRDTSGEPFAFTYRTRAECKVEADSKCAAKRGACKAICD
ncbi:MAG: hypothetical protein HY777_10810 [Betaproteobacteria bacterium]|nr:hypothetical protein [Betaproteobacteria bacterium]